MQTKQRIAAAVAFIVAGVLVTLFPVLGRGVAAGVALGGVLYAALLGVWYRHAYRTRGMVALVTVAYVLAAVGVLILLNLVFSFIDMRILVLVETVPMGVVTLVWSIECKLLRLPWWRYACIAGAGCVSAGLCALWRVSAVFGVGCLTAATLLLLAPVTAAIAARKAPKPKKSKTVTVNPDDIEILPGDDEAEK